ncbi:hypothetical protein Mal15_61270 [Stieleria maiorica]|uniref:Uncharacterized protein n=1 Tax=Stieleria maiorica TaxID=2795974 RepID=A0A5B9MM15_9BACT|nr:hypothetical protein [Stieleria maiorica]QEG02044.1 hypothetical protein Mal15_61270 [Stieleria maiorica]
MSLFNASSPTPSSEFPTAPIVPPVTGPRQDSPVHQGSQGQIEQGQIEQGQIAEGQISQGPGSEGFVDRRRQGGSKAGAERRQFGSSHDGLSEAGRELALAIDQYKLEHHRRYITCDEMLMVITNLGYSKS